MLKLISPNIEDFKPQAAETTQGTANNVFKGFHGFYGNLFLSKFVNGQADASGVDQGVVSARAIWSHGLRDFDLATVKTALSRTMDAHPEYPPTLPQFVALCKACAPRQAYQHPVAISMSAELRAQRSKAARESALLAITPTPAKKEPLIGLPLLKQLIAQAVGLAGGDEAKTLIRLDREFNQQGIPA
jgi:hypothetical protein